MIAINLLMTEPGITIAALAKEIGINTSAIQKLQLVDDAFDGEVL